MKHAPSARDSSAALRPDQSSCSSDTGDALIRSTRTPLPDLDWRREAGPGPGSVQINVQKLLKTRPSPDTGAPPRAAADGQPGKSSGHDLLTSRFTPGCRGIVLAALKQRSHSAPRRREVKVKLLNPGPLQTSSQDAVGVAGVRTQEELFSGRLGDVTNAAAAAAAAAVAATAPLIKAQSDMEARVCQLTDGVQRLLQADREDGERGWGLNQRTQQHQETLHSQQLQSQLLESALKIVTGHAPMTSTASDLTVSGPNPNPSRLEVTHLDTAANAHSNQQQSSPATRAATALETDPVAIATPSCDRRPEQTRGEFYHQAAPSVTSALQLRKETHSQSPANPSRVAASEANEVMREMGRLKSEIKMLLTPQDSVKTTRPPPDQHKSQQNLLHSQQIQDQQSQSQRPQHQQNSSHTQPIQSQQPYSDQTKSQPNHFQSQQSRFQQNQSQSRKVPSHQIQPQQNQSQFHSQSVMVHRGLVVPSMLEEAGGVLRQVRRQKKVLEENLEALLRAKNGEVLHCQLEALAANRDWTQEVRIKRTVDAWISTLSKDVQAETSSERAARSSAPSGRGRPISVLRQTGSKVAGPRGGPGQKAGHRTVQGAEPVPGGLIDREQVEGESYLTRLYGRAPYEGLRRTLKKSPYLRFTSPGSPLNRKPRPRLVESVRGVKVKSCKTQTSLTPPLSPSPGRLHHRLIFSSSHIMPGDPADLTVTPADTVPMAIPLGRRRVDSSSRCVTQHQQEMTSPPTPPTTFTVAAVVGAPEQQPQREEQLNAGEAPPLAPSHVVIETESEEEEDEENAFPGADFLSVADVLQVSSALPQEEESVVGEEAVELDGGPSPAPFMYQGPAFPPQACSALLAQGQASTLDTDQQRDALEERLVEWVEQQLMSRMISEMYRPPPSDPTHNLSTDHSELEEQSFTSDIVEAAGGGGLQLFVDSNVLVDSALIRQLVNEVLTETVVLMLGQRDALDTGSEPGLEPTTPGPAAHQEDNRVPLVPTPVPTPPPSPTITINRITPPTTPPTSEPTSLLIEECPQPITAAELKATPTPTPDPAPSAGSPPPLHQAPPPLTWLEAELPLDEERPEEHLDTEQQPLVMTVQEEDPPLSSPSVSSPSPRGPDADPGPASPSSSVSSSSAALKHISEGEVVISVNQLTTTTEEGAVCSFSSSLQELHDMDYDPPSEGQVRGHGLLLTLLTKMEQGVTPRGERPQPEGSWGRQDQGQEEEVSMGEVRDNRTTKPHRTTNPTDFSRSTAARRGQSSSPGQISQCSAEHEEEEEEEGGTRRMDVHLPSVRVEEEEEVMEEVSAAADTDSSTNDVF
ncbi:protein TALPID3 isoform X2 [Hippoglossus stenolepis]|uniref:protein TALPID3 isoform X2 n=1 Tax=Hippoglossus stenolepis TaxID=195615 RepID=UPI001FAF4BDB|nr:protein TALPID3 isoform X2 [Hippoglossus stenolepis]